MSVTPQGFAPCIKSPEKGSRCGGLLWLNSLGSLYCDRLCLALPLCLCVSLSLFLSSAAPRARQSALQPAWKLHNAPPALFLLAPLPSCAVAGFPRFTLLQHPPLSFIYAQLQKPPPPSSTPVAFWEQTGQQYVLMESAIMEEAAGGIGHVFPLYGYVHRLPWPVSHARLQLCS